MKPTVLVIEDQEQNQYLMKYLLESSGFRVVLVGDGIEGISRARVEAFDLVLLDIQLPTITGYEVARALRGGPPPIAVPIVAVTSYAMPGDREQALAAGCTGYIEKPIDPSRFVSALLDLCRDTGLADRLNTASEERPQP